MCGYIFVVVSVNQERAPPAQCMAWHTNTEAGRQAYIMDKTGLRTRIRKKKTKSLMAVEASPHLKIINRCGVPATELELCTVLLAQKFLSATHTYPFLLPSMRRHTESWL